MSLARAVLEITTDLSGFTPGVDKAKKATFDLGGVATKVGGMIAGAFAIGAITSAATDIVNFAGELTDLSAKTGIGTTALQELKYAGSQVGVELETITGAVTKMQDSIAGGNASAVSALKALGINFDTIKKQSPEDQFKTIAAKVAEIEDPAARVKLAMDLFGKSGAEMLPLMTKEFIGLTEKANTLGIVMDEETVAAMDTLGDTTGDLMAVGQALIGKVLTPMLPLLTMIANGAMMLADGIGDGLGMIPDMFRLIALGGVDVLRSMLGVASGVANLMPSLSEKLGLTKGIAAANAFLTNTENSLNASLAKTGETATKASKPVKQFNGDLAGTSDAAKQAKRDADAYQKSLDDLTGVTAQKNADLLAKKLKDITAGAGFTKAGYEAFTKEVVKAHEEGAKLSDEVYALYRNHVLLNKQIPISTDAYGQLADILKNMPSIELGPPPKSPWQTLPGDGKDAADWVNSLTPRNDDIRKWTSKVGGSLKEGFLDGLAGLGDVIIGAIQGGGDVGKAVGASLGSSMGAQLGKTLTTAIGGSLGKLVGGLAGPLGALAGSAIGGLVDKVFSGNDTKKGRENLARAMGFPTLAALNDAMRNMGEDGQRLVNEGLNKIGKKDTAANDAWMASVEKLFEDTKNKALEAAAATKALEDELAGMNVELGNLQKTSNPTWQDMLNSARDFGVEIDALGPKFQQQRLTEEATNIWNAFDTLKRGGADVGAVINGMTDEAQAFVLESLKFGTTVPENMKELLVPMLEAGTLLDENGEKLTDLSRLNFGEPVKSKWELIADSIKDLVKSIDAMVAKLKGPVVAAVGNVVSAFNDLPTSWEFDVKPNFGFAGAGGGADGRTDTGSGASRMSFAPMRFAAMSLPSLPAMAFSGAGAGASRPIVLQVDGREIARANIRHGGEAFRTVGWK